MSGVRRRLVVATAGLAIAALLGAVVLAALRVLDPTQTRLIQLTVFVPAGAPLAFAAAVAATCLARVGRRWLIVAAAALLITALHVAWQAPLYLGGVDRAADGESVTILTQNLEYGDPRGVLRLVAERGVDVLVLPDTGEEKAEALVAAGITDDLPYILGVQPHGGTLVFSRFPLGPETRISDGGDSRVVAVEVPGLGSIDLVAVHPTPPYQQPNWTDDHTQLRGFLEDRYGESPEQPIVIAGDLNATLDMAPMRELDDLGYTDALVQVDGGWQPTWPAAGSVRKLGIGAPLVAPIDHVLTAPTLLVTEMATLAVPGSDHLGVLAVVGRR